MTLRAQAFNDRLVAEERYTDEQGAEYFEKRAQCRSSYAQRNSAALIVPHLSGLGTVLDFGCGTGGILSLIPCEKRVGVEINEYAQKEARAKGITVYDSITEVASESVDGAMTHHALEHVLEPFAVMKEMHRVLKPGARFVVIVPAEEPRSKINHTWRPNTEQHLYSWNPLTLGNFLIKAGFELTSAEVADGGASGYLAPLEKIGPAHRVAKVVNAWVRSRWQTVCIVNKPR